MKKTSFLTKLTFIALSIFLAAQIVATSAKLTEIAREKKRINAEIAELEASVADLEYKLEHKDDDDVLEDIAREELGLVRQGEQVFYD